MECFGRGRSRGAPGTPPAGFLELEAAAEELPADNPLRKLVAGLRQALGGDYLREASIELYVGYWGELGTSLRTANPTLASRFADQLIRFLNAAYVLSTFVPVRIDDHPARMVGSRARRTSDDRPGGRRVHRPGLHDWHGNLCIPALVEVE